MCLMHTKIISGVLDIATHDDTQTLIFVDQVKAAVLDPDNDFDVERTLTKTDVQRLIQVKVCTATVHNIHR